MSDDSLPARRHVEARADGSRLEYSIPAGVADEEAAREVAEMLRAVDRGYTQRVKLDRGFGIDVRWLVRQPAWVRWAALRAQRLSRCGRLLDQAAFWLKRRSLDVYWRLRGDPQP